MRRIFRSTSRCWWIPASGR